MKAFSLHRTPVEIREKSVKMVQLSSGLPVADFASSTFHRALLCQSWDIEGMRAHLILLRVQLQMEGFGLNSRTGLLSS